jgi:hypothetical protein
LNDIPCEWALPVHDSIIVKEQDIDVVYNYIKVKYPELELKKNLLK